MWNYNFYVYITTNPAKTVLYIGVTNDLNRRLYEHAQNKGSIKLLPENTIAIT
jgi:putative endonuclease